MNNVLTDRKPISLFEEIEKLGFPSEEYMVAGSGVMGAKGIRDVYDLDLIVTHGLFNKCKEAGWELRPWTWKGDPTQGWLKKGDVELMKEIRYEGENVSIDFLKKGAERIKGIWFLSLSQLISIKKRSVGEKHKHDLELIDAYLES